VRAYPEGEASGDRGWLGSAELGWQLLPGWQAVAFADAGVVQVNSHAWDAAADNRRRLAGAGLGGRWAEAPGAPASTRPGPSTTNRWPSHRSATRGSGPAWPGSSDR
jgi:hemolysin activation/secretion protein